MTDGVPGCAGLLTVGTSQDGIAFQVRSFELKLNAQVSSCLLKCSEASE